MSQKFQTFRFEKRDSRNINQVPWAEQAKRGRENAKVALRKVNRLRRAKREPGSSRN